MDDALEFRDDDDLSVTQARIAENQSTFRKANERIEATAESMGILEPIPFICECARPHCTELLYLTLDEYEEVRSTPERFMTISGHQDIAVDAGAGRLVEERPNYAIVEKIGIAGDIARDRFKELSE